MPHAMVCMMRGMNPGKGHRKMARGAALWHAPRMEGAVKNTGIKNIKKPKKEKKEKKY
jgi:hypothetical protein